MSVLPRSGQQGNCRPRTLFSTLSLTGFTLARASGLLAIFSILYAIAIGFRFVTSRFLESILTQQISVRHLGVWRSNPLRWHAPAGAVGMFLFWFVAALGEQMQRLLHFRRASDTKEHRDSEDLNGEDFSSFSFPGR